MKKFISRLFQFCVPGILFLVVAEISLRNIPNDYKTKNGWLETNSANLEVLCLGSSHSLYGVNPKFMSLKGFNVSHVSQSLDLDLLLYEKYSKTSKNLQFLLVPVSYFSFVHKLSEGPESWRTKNYVLDYHLTIPSYSPKAHSEVLSLAPKLNAKRLLKYYVRKHSEITMDSLGNINPLSAGSGGNLKRTGIMAATRHTFHDLSREQELISILDRIIMIASNSDVEVILFTPPAHHFYKENLNVLQLERMTAIAQSYESKNAGVSYYNFLDSLNYVDDDFFNADHLSNNGSRKLTRALNDRMMVILNLAKADSVR